NRTLHNPSLTRWLAMRTARSINGGGPRAHLSAPVRARSAEGGDAAKRLLMIDSPSDLVGRTPTPPAYCRPIDMVCPIRSWHDGWRGTVRRSGVTTGSRADGAERRGVRVRPRLHRTPAGPVCCCGVFVSGPSGTANEEGGFVLARDRTHARRLLLAVLAATLTAGLMLPGALGAAASQ